jgi:hypothetical protein
MAISSPKRRGPLPARNQSRYNVILDEELAEWGKRQPGGLSRLLRALLADAREQARLRKQRK